MQGEGVGERRAEGTITIPPARICLLFCVCANRIAKSGTRLGTAAAPKQATKQQETTQQYQQRFVHFLVENKERRRSALLPPRFQVASLLLSTQIVGGKKTFLFPNSSQLQALLKTSSPYLYPHLTHSSYASPLTKCRKITKLSARLVPSCRTAFSPSPAPHSLLSAAELCPGYLVLPSMDLVSRLYRGRKRQKKYKRKTRTRQKRQETH